MGKNTKILLGVGVLAAAYYFYKTTKESAVVSSIDTKTPLNMPTSSISTPIASVTPIKADSGGLPSIPTKKEVQDEIDRLAQIKAYEEENARQEAMRLANQQAYQASLQAEDARQKEIDDAISAAIAEAARQKAMNDLMYKCPEGLEYFEGNCMPTYIIVEAKAKRGEGLILRDMYKGEVSLVQTCSAEYVKQGINCIPRYSLSPQQLQVLAMEEAGMVQTSDGQWYTNSVDAAIAQSRIDANTSAQGRGYTARQSAINDAICSIDRDGYINNPNSSTNGMSLGKYIGEYKVTANELAIARASCPNSVYSSNLIAGGRADDNALGYK